MKLSRFGLPNNQQFPRGQEMRYRIFTFALGQADALMKLRPVMDCTHDRAQAKRFSNAGPPAWRQKIASEGKRPIMPMALRNFDILTRFEPVNGWRRPAVRVVHGPRCRSRRTRRAPKPVESTNSAEMPGAVQCGDESGPQE